MTTIHSIDLFDGDVPSFLTVNERTEQDSVVILRATVAEGRDIWLKPKHPLLVVREDCCLVKPGKTMLLSRTASIQILLIAIRPDADLHPPCTPQARHHRSGLGASRRRLIIEHIEKHLDEELRLGNLAKLANLSRHHFCRAFKVTFGMPPGRYITERRIDRAKGLLRDSRRSITEIALDLGFASHSHFTDAFRKITGITPSRYRHDHA